MVTVHSTDIFVGIDLHKDQAQLAVLRGLEREFHAERSLPATVDAIKRYLKRLAGEGQVYACYEAGGFGYVLQRALSQAGIACSVIAPSLIARKPGERRKTDRLDAQKLARQLRNGDLVAVRVPSEEEEQMRDVVRAREALRREVHRSRQHILKLLLRLGLRAPAENWTVCFWSWLRKLELPADQQQVLEAYIALLDTKLQLRNQLEARIVELSERPEVREVVGRLRCLRGIDTLSAMVLAVEIGDPGRFPSARKLMGYLGLGVAESSSGGTSRRFGITKTGNGRCRRILVEAAWHYRRRPRLSKALQRRQEGQAQAVVSHAWRAQRRLHKRFERLQDRMPRPRANAAVARELVGFVWALMRGEPDLLCDPRTR